MEKGYLALVLHAHLPFVRHPENDLFLEERWLFEAITETYIPLLQVFQDLVTDGVDFRVTLSITPTLLSMLDDSLLQERYLQHLQNMIQLAEIEVKRTQESPDFYPLAKQYRQRIIEIYEFYERCHHDIIALFRALQDMGHLEVITSAATHAFLPLTATEESVRAQVLTGIEVYERYFGRKPVGIWLPECGYYPGLDVLLRECGLNYFLTDTHGVTTAEPSPVFGTFSPVLTLGGVAAFARDESSSKQVWSSKEGYPGDFDYREYYRDIGFDLDIDTIGPFIHPSGIRVNTGFKYYRITGDGVEKQPYRLDWAREKAAVHAGDFLFHRQQQVAHWSYHMGRKPIIVAPYDAELFGHWWYEGPLWIDMLLRKMHFDQDILQCITPSEYLGLYDEFQECRLSMSSWGRDGYADVWLRGENDWIYPTLHLAEHRMIELANRFSSPSCLEQRALQQAARELMLAQSSDWAFIMDSKTMVDYAVRRTKSHIARFNRLYEMLLQNAISESWLNQVEALDALFPQIDYRHYRSRFLKHIVSDMNSTQPKVLVLSWEFPPMTVGGLSRHVYDLTRHLSRMGWEVHVVTAETGWEPREEVVEGVFVHRVQVPKPDGNAFLHWAFQLNLAMFDEANRLMDAGIHFDLIHAHDWLVCYAGKTLKEKHNLPLIATIHATEHGRNHGIDTDVQRYIHHLEWTLTYEAARVIVCSASMQREVVQLFQLPEDKIDILPNGVDTALFQGRDCEETLDPAFQREKVVFFVGRLVREKGVHLLLQAVPLILAHFPDVQFIIAGQGPMREELIQQVMQLGIRDHVQFLGFIADEERNRLFAQAQVAVFPSLYEPFGIVALEAMAAGTPVVVAAVGGLQDVVSHEINGLTALPDHVQSLADQITVVFSHPEWAEEMARTAKEHVKQYNWEFIAEKTAIIYNKVLHAAKGWDSDESSNHGGWYRDASASIDVEVAQTDGSTLRTSMH